ncbi:MULTISPECIES: serine hydrolase [Saccharothrix]|uniref:serine hydrolase n=1 Tax=Saccharothrix TaxID=2071 RepID=UPI003082AE72
MARLVNVYGPTETTIWSTSWDVPESAGEVLIGRPIANTRVHVLDARHRRVPVGVTGELYIAGDGVAQGYAARPDLTAERFVPEPFGRPGSRMYRTGDLARFTRDGCLDFLGRADHQVKVRGHRIEPAEIEAALLRHPGVTDVVVTARTDGDGEQTLVAYFVPTAGSPAVGTSPAPAELAAFLGETLPDYMVPAAFVPLPAFPLSTAGKIDRKALPAPDRAALGARKPYLPPTTDTERRLAAIWQRVLDVDRIGRDDRFFELGGNSMRVVRFLAVAREEGIELSLATLYQHDTIADLARLLDRGAAPRPSGLPSPVAMMAEHHVPGVSIAVIDDGRLVATHTYGELAAGGGAVTPDTLFQVGSISKHVAALAALRLVAEGVLDLDGDVNRHLTSWRVPYPAAGSAPVTPRLLMANLSGLSPTSNEPYHPAKALPTVLDVLRGEPPAEPPGVHLVGEPGREFVKHNTHFAVLQQLLVDVTGRDFAGLMRELVFDPLGMVDSSYDYAYPEVSGRPVALGHDGRGQVLDGG